MKTSTRILSAISALLFTLVLAGPAAAQYGEDPPETVIVGVGFADQNGEFLARYTAPDEIAETYLIYVVGTDEDHDPFEYVLANVTPGFAGLTWTLNGIDMEPGSEFTIEARHHEGTELGAQVLGITQLPATGTDSRSLAGLGVVMVVLGGAMFYGSRVRTSHLA